MTESYRAPVAPQVVQPNPPAPDVEDNLDAARILGKRHEDVGRDGVVIIDLPGELGYHCPVCVYPQRAAGEMDERLAWSEYRTMLWCYVCGCDYPSALCLPDDPVKATAVYLSCVEQIATARTGATDA